MSNTSNDLLFQRAREVQQYFESTIIDEAIDELIKHNELEELEAFVTQQEAQMSQDDFFNNDMMAERDEY